MSAESTSKTDKKSVEKTAPKKRSKSSRWAAAGYEAVRQKVEQALSVAVASSIALIILGIMFIIFPESFLSILRWIVAIVCFLVGAAIFAIGMRRQIFFGTAVIATILVLVGLAFATQPGAAGIFSIILGVWFIMSALASSGMATALSGASAFLTGFMSFISLVCGILLIINPFGGSVSIMMFLGILTLIHAVSSLVDVLILKSHLDELSKRIKPTVIDGEEE